MDAASHHSTQRNGRLNGQNGDAHPGDGEVRRQIANHASPGRRPGRAARASRGEARAKSSSPVSATESSEELHFSARIVSPGGLELRGALGDRRWRARHAAQKPRPGTLRLVLWVEREGAGPSAFHRDTVNLFRARSRDEYVRRAAARLGLTPDVVERDLDQLQRHFEALDEAPPGRAPQATPPELDLSEAERAEALELLKSPNLLARIAVDLASCGLFGPEALALYLAGCSRLAARPLAIVVPSGSAAGKRLLPSHVLQFFPPEDVFQDDLASAHSLHGHGESGLTRKIAFVSGRRPIPDLSSALQHLHEKKHWVTSRLGNGPATEESSRPTYRVNGPTAIIVVGLEEAFPAPCLVLPGEGAGDAISDVGFPDEGLCTSAELERRQAAEDRRRVHRNAQRLLQPVAVILPSDLELPPAPRGRGRRRQRDHLTCLALACCVAILHQHQRPLQTRRIEGKIVHCVEVTPEDLAAAARLLRALRRSARGELLPRTRQILEIIRERVGQIAAAEGIPPSAVRFSRQDILGWIGGGTTQLHVHVSRLEKLGDLIVHQGGRGQNLIYELDDPGDEEAGEPAGTNGSGNPRAEEAPAKGPGREPDAPEPPAAAPPGSTAPTPELAPSAPPAGSAAAPTVPREAGGSGGEPASEPGSMNFARPAGLASPSSRLHFAPISGPSRGAMSQAKSPSSGDESTDCAGALCGGPGEKSARTTRAAARAADPELSPSPRDAPGAATPVPATPLQVGEHPIGPSFLPTETVPRPATPGAPTGAGPPTPRAGLPIPIPTPPAGARRRDREEPRHG